MNWRLDYIEHVAEHGTPFDGMDDEEVVVPTSIVEEVETWPEPNLSNIE